MELSVNCVSYQMSIYKIKSILHGHLATLMLESGESHNLLGQVISQWKLQDFLSKWALTSPLHTDGDTGEFTIESLYVEWLTHC